MRRFNSDPVGLSDRFRVTSGMAVAENGRRLREQPFQSLVWGVMKSTMRDENMEHLVIKVSRYRFHER
jgi:hypothetical protein